MAHRLCCHFFSWATFSHTSCCQRRIPSQLCRAFQGSRFHRHFSPKKSKWSQTASNPASILVDKIFNGRTNQLASSLWLSRRNRDAFSSPILFWWPTVQFLYKYCSERWFFQRLFRTLIQQGDRTQLSCPGDCSPPCPLLLTNLRCIHRVSLTQWKNALQLTYGSYFDTTNFKMCHRDMDLKGQKSK